MVTANVQKVDTRYVLSVRQAADYLGIPVATLYKMAERREIDHLRTKNGVAEFVVAGRTITRRNSGRLKFSEAGLEAWIAAHRVTVAPVVAPAASTPQPKPVELPMPARRRFGL